MNFFDHQRRARRNTLFMSMGFVAAHAITAFLLIFVVFLCLGGVSVIKEIFLNPVLLVYSLLSSPFFYVPFVGYFLYIALCVYLKWCDLEHPDKYFALKTDAERIFRDRPYDDFFISRFLNAAEEMSIAAGIPMPRLYIVPNDSSLNAFAVGWNHLSSAIFITEGALRGFNRDELQAVVGHELSHIINGDTRSGTIMLVMTEVLAGFSSALDTKVLEKVVLPQLILLAVSALGALLSEWIQSSFSRQKEYLADASSAQFTRNPHSLVTALQKIAALDDLSLGKSSVVPDALAHLTFSPLSTVSSTGGSLSEIFSLSSHPPILRRIQRLAPNTQHVFTARAKKLISPKASYFYDGYAEDMALGFVSSARPTQEQLAKQPMPYVVERRQTTVQNPIKQEDLMFRVGKIPEESVLLAKALEKTAPASLLRRDFSLESFILASVLMPEHLERKGIHSMYDPVCRIFGAKVFQEAKDFSSSLGLLPSLSSVSFTFQILPRFKRLSAEQINELSVSLDALYAFAPPLCQASLIKNASHLVIKSYLNYLKNPQKSVFGSQTLISRRCHIEDVIWCFAQLSSNPELIFQKACRSLGYMVIPGKPLGYSWPDIFDKIIALDSLNGTSKESFIRVAMDVICFDSYISAEEIGLVQGLCFALRCPFPPLFVQETPILASQCRS